MLKITNLHSGKEAVKKLLEKLNDKAQTAVLVVEGKKDAAALELFISADFFLLQDAKKSLYETAEDIAASYKRAILLFDADPKGRQLTSRMAAYLRQNGVAADISFGPKLMKAANCRTIQGLKRIIKQIINEM